MRRIITCLIALLFFSLQISAQQVPNGFNYQSIARDAMGLPIVNTQIKLRITVRQNSTSGTDVWQETQTATTNQFGLINLVVGNGTKSGGLASITGINSIDWSSDVFFIVVEVDNGGGSYAQLGITQFQSVPYALASDNALRIQGSKVGAIIPTANQFLKYNSISGQWEPGNISGANGGTVISVGGIGPITVTGNSGLAPQINILQSSAIQDGYLSALDWAVFANKLGTTTGFSGNLSGTYDAITVTGIQNVPVSSTAPTNGQILMYDGIQWVPTTTGATSGVTTVIGSGEISVTAGASPVISISTASGTSSGVITAADYISFSNKLTINSIAGGDLSGPYNNLIVNSIGSIPISLASAPAGSVLSFNGIGFVPAVFSGSVNISTTTPGVSTSGSIINITTADGTNFGLLTPTDYNRFANKVDIASIVSGDVSGSYQDGFTVTGLGTKSLNITGILPGQVLSFNGTAFVPGTPSTSLLTSITGINGIIVGGSGTLYSVDGSNLITVTTVFGGDLSGTYNSITVNRVQNVPFSLAGITNGQYLYFNGTSIVGFNVPSAIVPTLTGMNGVTLNTNTGYNFTISGQTLATYSGDNLLTTLTGTFPNFTIAGIAQSGQLTTLSGSNGLSIAGSGLSQTIIGQSFIGSNGIIISSTGNSFTISNTTPGLLLKGDGINTSVTGSNNSYTVLGIGVSSQWVNTTAGNIFYSVGKIGVGNINPTSDIHVFNSTTNSNLKIESSISSGSAGLILASDAQTWTTVVHGSTNGSGNPGEYLLYDNTSSNTRFRVMPGTGNIVIGVATVPANEKLTVEGNVTILGIGYANGFSAATLTLTGIGSGILTVDGFGNVTTTSLSFASTPTTLVGMNGLSVAGSGFLQTIIGQNFIGTNGILVSSSGANFAISITAPGLSLSGDNVNTSVVGTNNNYTVLGIGTGSQWVSTTGGIYYPIGVGINALPSASPLIIGTSSTWDIAFVPGVGSSATIHSVQDLVLLSDANLTLNSVADMTFITNSIDRLKILSSGQVGIGTQTPNEELTVQGNSSVSGIGYASGFRASTLTLTGIGSGILTVDGFGNVTTTSLSFSTTPTTLIGANGLSVAGTGFNQTIIGQNFIAGNGIVINTSTGGNITITGTTTNQWITTLGGIYYSGSTVGIGVAPFSGVGLSIQSSSGGSPLYIQRSDGSHAFRIDETGSGSKMWLYSTSNTIGALISTDPGSDSYINVNSNFGLGTSTPNQKLTVQGNSSVSGIGYASGFRANTLTLTGIGSGILTVDGFGNVTTTSLSITSSQWVNTTNGIYYNNNIGIGTINPITAIHISKGAGSILRMDDNLGGGAIAIGNSGTAGGVNLIEYTTGVQFKAATYNNVGLGVGGTDMVIQNGLIGIGTFTPNEQLTVQSNASVAGITYTSGLKSNFLTLTGIGTGILTVDGFGNVTTTSLSFTTTQTTLTGTGGLSVAGSGFSQTIIGQNFIGTNGIVVSSTGNTFTITNTIPGLTLKGDGVNTSVTGSNNNYTVLGIGNSSQWINTIGGIYYGSLVGIGMSPDPGHVFSIKSRVGIDPFLIQRNGSTYNMASFSEETNGGSLYLYDGSSNAIPTRITSDNLLPSYFTYALGIGTSTPNEILTVYGNSSVSGIGYASGLKASTLTLAGIGSGILTVDGFGNVTTTSLSFATTPTTLIGMNGLSVAGSGFSQTIIGQNFTGSNGIVVSSTGNTFTISNTTPGLSLFGDGINTSVTGSNNTYTVLGIGVSSQWITTTSGIYYNSGNVGIGTANSSEKLTVFGNSSVTGAGYFNDVNIASTITLGSFITIDGSTNTFQSNSGLSVKQNNVGSPFILESATDNAFNAAFIFNTYNSASVPTKRLVIYGNEDIARVAFLNASVGIGNTFSGVDFGVLGNASITGTAYIGTIIGNNLAGAPLGSIVTVDGFGKLGYGTLSSLTQTLNTISGINGVSVITGTGYDFTVDGANFITSIIGTNGVSVNRTGQFYTVSGTNVTLASYSGDNLLTTLTGAFPNFTIAGITQINSYPTISGQGGIAITTLPGGLYSIDGSAFVNKTTTGFKDVLGSFQTGFTVAGLAGAPINTPAILPGYALQFDGTSIIGSSFVNTITGSGGVIVGTITGGYSIDGSNLSLGSIVGTAGLSVVGSGLSKTISGAGQVILQQSLGSSMGSASASFNTLTGVAMFKVPVSIPSNVKTVSISLNAYGLVGTSSADYIVVIGGSTSPVSVNSNDPDNIVPMPDLDVSASQGQTVMLKVYGKVSGSETAAYLQGITITVKN